MRLNDYLKNQLTLVEIEDFSLVEIFIFAINLSKIYLILNQLTRI